MPFVDAVTHLSLPLLPVAELAHAALMLSLLASLLMFFRPLLSGLLRALVLTVRPRAARRQPSASAGA
jgi:hypothetical protein